MLFSKALSHLARLGDRPKPPPSRRHRAASSARAQLSGLFQPPTASNHPSSHRKARVCFVALASARREGAHMFRIPMLIFVRIAASGAVAAVVCICLLGLNWIGVLFFVFVDFSCVLRFYARQSNAPQPRSHAKKTLPSHFSKMHRRFSRCGWCWCILHSEPTCMLLILRQNKQRAGYLYVYRLS